MVGAIRRFPVGNDRSQAPPRNAPLGTTPAESDQIEAHRVRKPSKYRCFSETAFPENGTLAERASFLVEWPRRHKQPIAPSLPFRDCRVSHAISPSTPASHPLALRRLSPSLSHRVFAGGFGPMVGIGSRRHCGSSRSGCQEDQRESVPQSPWCETTISSRPAIG